MFSSMEAIASHFDDCSCEEASTGFTQSAVIWPESNLRVNLFPLVNMIDVSANFAELMFGDELATSQHLTTCVSVKVTRMSSNNDHVKCKMPVSSVMLDTGVDTKFS